MRNPRVVVLVSSDPSDVYFANQIIKHVNVVGILVERLHQPTGKLNHMLKAFVHLRQPFMLRRKLNEVWTRKYYGRKAKKISQTGFGKEGYELSKAKNYQLIFAEGQGAINGRDCAEWLKALQPGAIAVCGTSMLRKPILRITPNIVNLHSGLSQKYRGTWTTLWAIYNEEPEYVGHTVHFVTPGIDDGDVICQGRPIIAEDDNHETLYVKVVKLGTVAVLKVIDDIQSNSIRRYSLLQKGKLYQRSMLTSAIIKKTWQKVNAGLIRNYVKCPKDVELIGNKEGMMSGL
jgi:methionyl-tRNA formyltransferase